MRVEIHEFSTGIQAEKTADGWVSRGFTGEYMNRTLNAIPAAVQNAIRNREFAVAEGTSSADPAIIGRVVWDSDRPQSVVAVVTRGRDDRGRSASMYRYFLCEGSDRIGYILGWMRQRGGTPIFDPFDRPAIGQPHIFEGNPMAAINLRPQLQALLAGGQPAIVPHTEACTPAILNQMAEQLDGLTAWAYKVEALEQPRAFQVIQPASQRAEDLLRRTVASLPAVPVPVAGGRSEQDIKSAVKGLMAGRVKVEQLQTLEAAFGDDRFDANYWTAIFDGQGANKARGFYSEQMVRLLTLRAIAVPETLPEFLSWMGGEGDKGDRFQTSDDFQNQVLEGARKLAGYGPNITDRVASGTRSIIPMLCDRPQLVEPTVWLLQNRGLWGTIYAKAVRQEIDNDLKLMSRQAIGHQVTGQFKLMGHPAWKTLLGQLGHYWQNTHSRPLERYQPLGDLFSELNSPEIAAFFSHVGYGYASEKVFSLLPNRRNYWYASVYGLNVQKEIGLVERTVMMTHEVGRTIMPLYFAIPLMVLMFVAGIFFRDISPFGSNRDPVAPTPPTTETPLAGSENEAVDPATVPSSSTEGDPTLPSERQTDNATAEEGTENPEAAAVATNKGALEQLITDFDRANRLRVEVEPIILEILELNRFAFINDVPDPRLKEAIAAYQLKQDNLVSDGIISLPSNTSEPTENASVYWVLKCDIADRLNQTLSNRPAFCPPAPQTPTDDFSGAPPGEG